MQGHWYDINYIRVNFEPLIILQYNDISILTLDSPVQFSHQIRPICLPATTDNFAGHTGTVIGWGSLRESKSSKLKLQLLHAFDFRWSTTFSFTGSQYSNLEQF